MAQTDIDRCVFVYCVGRKYEKHFHLLRQHFENFALLNNAHLHIQRKPLDPSMRHNLMMQRLLIPSKMQHYKHVLSIDLDVFFARPLNFFNEIIDLDVDCACWPVDNSDTALAILYKELWSLKRTPHVGKNNIVDHINGGLIYFNSENSWKIMKEVYWSEQLNSDKLQEGFNNEEGVITRLINDKSLSYAPLDTKFNDQIIWRLAVSAPEIFDVHRGMRGKFHRYLKKLDLLFPIIESYLYGVDYRRVVDQAVSSSKMIHFSGGFPYPYDLLKNKKRLSY